MRIVQELDGTPVKRQMRGHLQIQMLETKRISGLIVESMVNVGMENKPTVIPYHRKLWRECQNNANIGKRKHKTWCMKMMSSQKPSFWCFIIQTGLYFAYVVVFFLSHVGVVLTFSSQLRTSVGRFVIWFKHMGRNRSKEGTKHLKTESNLPWVPLLALVSAPAWEAAWRVRCKTPCRGKWALAGLELMPAQPGGKKRMSSWRRTIPQASSLLCRPRVFIKFVKI